MIIDDIKKANTEAMKNRDQNLRNIYSVVINKYMQATIEARTTNTPVTDDEVVRIIQKTIKELDEECANYEKVGNTEEVEKIKNQRAAIECYLPKMLTADEIYKIIEGLTDRAVPTVMRYFKAEFGSRVDMKMVGEQLKKF